MTYVTEEEFIAMEKVVSEIDEYKSFEQILDESFVSLKPCAVVKGTVVQVTQKEIVLDIGYKCDGIITKENFSNSQVDLENEVKIGDQIEAVVLKIDDSEGKVSLSRKKLETSYGFKELEKAFNDGAILTGRVVSFVKSGLRVSFKGTIVFIPASRLLLKDSKKLNDYLGEKIDFKLIEFNRARKRYIGSQREKNKKMQIIDVHVGDKVEAVIDKIVDYGVFCNFGVNSGLLHISQINSDVKENFKDIFKIGDKINLFIRNINHDKGQIGLSMNNKSKKNVWEGVSEKYPAGKIVRGRVARIANFGAFIEIEKGLDGLLHISQICENEHIDNINDKINIGDILNLRVVRSDEERKRISLSMIGVEQ